MENFALIFDGKPHTPKDSFEVFNPANGELVGRAPCATPEDLDAAVEAAARAYPGWSRTPDAERKSICEKLGNVLEANAEELATLLTKEQGKPLGGLGSRFELGGAISWTRYTASLDLPVEILQDDNTGRIELHRKPMGVVASITPWNWPLMIAIWHIMPALRTGNTIVIKPSPMTPLSTLRMVELLAAELPAGVLNVITGPDALGAHLSSHPKVAKVSFTGSTQTGKKVMNSAVDTLKRLTLELGGNDAGIILPDVDPKGIAENLFWGAFVNNGQTCACLKRLYVHDDIYDEVCTALAEFAKTIPVGDGLSEDSVLGPVQNEMQLNKVVDLVEDAKAKGGRFILGGEKPDGPGYFFPITLIADATPGMRVVDEEQFGPVLPIIRYTDVDQALAMANESDMGLGGSVWSRDIEKAKALALQLESGSAWVNSHGGLNPLAPFGGVKQSGIGVEFGIEGLKELTVIQTLHI